MTNKFWSFAVTGLIAFLSLVALGPAQEPYYQDKTIRILVGYSLQISCVIEKQLS